MLISPTSPLSISRAERHAHINFASSSSLHSVSEISDQSLVEEPETERREWVPEMQPLTGKYRMPGPGVDQRRLARFSTVAMEMLREREDRDLHPYGRGGRFEGFLYDSRRVKVTLDHSKMLAWVSMALLLILLTGAIIYLAAIKEQHLFKSLFSNTTFENDRKRNFTLTTTTVKPDDTTTTSTVG